MLPSLSSPQVAEVERKMKINSRGNVVKHLMEPSKIIVRNMYIQTHTHSQKKRVKVNNLRQKIQKKKCFSSNITYIYTHVCIYDKNKLT